jgi:hypothetical protein
MPLSMSELSLPAFSQGLEALASTLAKAEEHAAATKVDEGVFLQARLYPDMFPMVRQVQIACDFAKGAVARLSGAEVPSWPDDETSFAALRARVARTLDYVRSVPAAALDGSEERSVVLQAPGRTLAFRGADYLLSFVLPNFYFHLTTAYGLLRHNGVAIGKRDFVGALRLQ